MTWRITPLLLLLFILPFPGTVTLRLLCLAAAFVIAVALWRGSATPPLPCKLTIALWAGVALLSLAYAVDPAYSLGEIKNEIGYTLMAFAAFFALTRNDEDLKMELIALFAGALALCGWALLGRYRMGSWIEGGGHGGTAAFAGYAIMLAPMLFLSGFRAEGKGRVLAPALFVVVAVTAFFSLQRVVWPVLFVEATIALILLRYRGLVRISPIAMLGIFVAGALLVLGMMTAVKHERFRAGERAGVLTEDPRLAQWPAVAKRIMDTPLSGSGFGRGVMRKAHRDLIPQENTLLWHAHNTFLNYGLGMGLPGIAALMIVLLCLLRRYWLLVRGDDRGSQLLGMAGIMLLAGVVLRNQVSDMFVRDQAILFWALNGALLGLGSRRLRPGVT